MELLCSGSVCLQMLRSQTCHEL